MTCGHMEDRRGPQPPSVWCVLRKNTQDTCSQGRKAAWGGAPIRAIEKSTVKY